MKLIYLVFNHRNRYQFTPLPEYGTHVHLACVEFHFPPICTLFSFFSNLKAITEAESLNWAGKGPPSPFFFNIQLQLQKYLHQFRLNIASPK